MTKPKRSNSTLPIGTQKGFNSTLAPGGPLKSKTRLKTRDYRTRTPGKYGHLFNIVKVLPCFVKALNPRHRCGLGYAPWTAHHVIPGGLDVEGLVPCCGKVHDVLEAQKRRTMVTLTGLKEGELVVDIREQGRLFVARAQDTDPGDLDI